MIKEIDYNGLSVIPSDYSCKDGELSTLVGMVPENGDLHPIAPPKKVYQLSEGDRLLYVHKTTSYTHLIFIDEWNEHIWWIDEGSDTKHYISLPVGLFWHDEVRVEAIGNTLMFFIEDVEKYITYYLWRNNGYIRLGEHLPEVNLSFGLQGHPRVFSKTDASQSTFTINFNNTQVNKLCDELSDENKERITSQIMAKVNKFLAEQTVNKGRFALPFFVRYALRLYDNTLVMHSAPILMNPCTTNNPICYWVEAYSKHSTTTVDHAVCDLFMMACDLDYEYNSASSGDIAQWSDIIKSVDIFISQPLYPYDQNGQITTCGDTDDFHSVFIGKLYNEGGSSTVVQDKYLEPVTIENNALDAYTEWLYNNIYALYYKANRTVPHLSFHLPEYSNEKRSQAIEDCSQFYLLHSINLEDLQTTRTVIPIDNDYLKTLVNREVMTDDYLTHDLLTADHSFVYNGRVNLAGVQRKLFIGFPLSNMLTYCNDRVSVIVNNNTITLDRGWNDGVWHYLNTRYAVEVDIKENGLTYTLRVSRGVTEQALVSFLNDNTLGYNNGDSWGSYFYYPNRNAFKMRIRYNGYIHMNEYYEFNLKPHPFLNGAYAFLGYDQIRNASGTSSESKEDHYEIIDASSKLYTSQVNNPFYFPLEGIKDVGVGKILGLATAEKPMSVSQFGQYPLYAFTDECVWSLQPSDTGYLRPAQPVVQDVCINANSITQLDSSVLFATDRGIMLISGSETTCITDILGLEELFLATNLNKLSSLTGTPLGEYVPFSTFLDGCRIIYSYVKQRIIIYNPEYSYSYVYSLKSKLWATSIDNIQYDVTYHPNAYAVLADGKVVDFNRDEDDEEVEVTTYDEVLVTRPLKLDTPHELKTIHTIIQRGHFTKGHVKTILYGSNDLEHWFMVWTSVDHYLRGFSGTPYKYYRIALICNLNKGETLTGCSIDYTPKRINKLR